MSKLLKTATEPGENSSHNYFYPYISRGKVSSHLAEQACNQATSSS